VAEILAAELGADSQLPSDLKYCLLKIGVSEAVSE
jgi:hypothetical protein